MKSANKEILLSLFQNNYQYHIPFFQRAYVWDEDNWDLFWEHLNEEKESYKNKEESEHFIGTIITKPIPSDNLSSQPLELIDGQQRITTIAILLKAMADTVDGSYPKLKDNLIQYVKFEDARGEEYLRVKHSQRDSKYFENIMRAPDEIIENSHLIDQAYSFFFQKVKNFSDEERDQLKNVLLHRIPVISMMLTEKDDEQEIFDTINSLGVRLTTAELLKNYIFRDYALQDMYKSTWEDGFENDDDTVSFWNTEKTSGRVHRTNHELLLYCFLIIETGKEIRLDKLFNEYKKYLKDKNTDEKKNFLSRLKTYADTYYKFPSGSELNEISFSDHVKRVFHVIENLEISTVYPLLLYIYQNTNEGSERIEMLQLLESYLVRRQMIKLTVKNYNKVFIGIINELKNRGEVSYKVLKEIIDSFQDETNRCPDDREFASAFNNTSLANKYAKEILYCISLYQLNDPYGDVQRLSSNSYSVEHILPKKWDLYWSDSSMTEDQKKQREWKLKTMGNLTLVTKPLNSSLKNSSWDKKKEVLTKYSRLKISSDYLDLTEWNESQIEKRANDLAEIALQIWKK